MVTHSHTIATHTSFPLVITMMTIDNHAHFGRNMAKKIWLVNRIARWPYFRVCFLYKTLAVHSVPVKCGLNSKLAATQRLGIAGVHCIHVQIISLIIVLLHYTSTVQ